MTKRRGHEPKTDLTPDEKLRVGFAYLILGVASHHLAAMYGVNPGRIAGAVSEIRAAIGWNDADEEGESQ